MVKIDVFDPPMCCASGVCGPEMDPDLTRFAAELDAFRRQGVVVARYNLAQEPMAFVQNEVVQAALQEDDRCLPLVLLDGQVVSRERYPPAGMLADALAERAPTNDDEMSVPDYLVAQPDKEVVHDA